jgi:DNA-binding protein H-NS
MQVDERPIDGRHPPTTDGVAKPESTRTLAFAGRSWCALWTDPDAVSAIANDSPESFEPNLDRRISLEIQTLSVDELKAQLEQIEQSKANIERALVQRWQEQKGDLAQQIRQMIDEHGYDHEEIMGLVVGRRRRGGAAKKTGQGYLRYVDPENPENVYTRGVLPRWMKDRMTSNGYDPSVKADREAFKAKFLRAERD